MIRLLSIWAIGFSTLLLAGDAGNDAMLGRVGKQVELFWDYFPAVTCTEAVVQTKLDQKGKILSERRSSYDYLVLLQSAGGDFSIEESRIDKGVKAKGAKASFLVTNGFSTLLLIFHPQFQSSYEFRVLPGDRIEFRHLPGYRSPSALVLKDREYPLEWKGVAQIEPSTGAITRIHAELSAPMEEIGLLNLQAEVNYARVRFSGLASEFHLPETATIDAATRRQSWRNVHQFANYRRFEVQTESRTADPH